MESGSDCRREGVVHTPFNIGEVYYLPHHDATNVKVDCPVCAGQLYVTVVTGSGEQVKVSCDACGLGYDGPRGWITEYSYEPFVERFEIAAVDSFHNDEWTVRSTGGSIASFKSLFMTEAEARIKAEQYMQALIDDNMRRSATSNKMLLKKKTWTVRYHEDCIRELQRKIEWHRGKVSERQRCL